LSLTIERRYRGPARSGNGGYTAGLLATYVPGATGRAIEVTLRTPPPLETPLEVATEGEVTRLLDAETLVAEARVVPDRLVPVEAVDAGVAAQVMSSYRGLEAHPFPGCFACGPEREPGDGLQIFPGAVPDREGTVASLWVPHAAFAERGDVVDPGVERVGVPVTWAALDCVGGWAEALEGRPMVLGRITVRVDALPVVGEPHVAVGNLRGAEGRKSFTASTLYDADGRVVATAEHTWIAVDPSVFN
jgi:hypothetical protein